MLRNASTTSDIFEICGSWSEISTQQCVNPPSKLKMIYLNYLKVKYLGRSTATCRELILNRRDFV
jgi:hypothetical protein